MPSTNARSRDFQNQEGRRLVVLSFGREEKSRAEIGSMLRSEGLAIPEPTVAVPNIHHTAELLEHLKGRSVPVEREFPVDQVATESRAKRYRGLGFYTWGDGTRKMVRPETSTGPERTISLLYGAFPLALSTRSDEDTESFASRFLLDASGSSPSRFSTALGIEILRDTTLIRDHGSDDAPSASK